MPKPKVLTIIGPTASGKTEVSIKAAQEIKSKTGKDVEIISADSRQVYKHIPIATAQPSKDYLKRFKHHFIAELSLNEEFNAGEFGKRGRVIIDKIIKKGNVPVIVGGSGLYISSLIYGLFKYDEYSSPDKDEYGILSVSPLTKVRYIGGVTAKKQIREKLYEKLEKHGLDKLFYELKKVDPETADNMTQVTERRVIRALEVYHLTGMPISALRRKKIDVGFDSVQIGINWNRSELKERINKRVDLMLEQGLVEEVKRLKDEGFHYKKYNSLNTVGIKEVFYYLDDLIKYDKMAELIKQNTRRFAKRQLTWFGRDKNIKWVNHDDVTSNPLHKLTDLLN